jgi:hypothetical protein
MSEKMSSNISGSREGRAERMEMLRERIRTAERNALDVASEGAFIQQYADLCDAEKFPFPPDGFDPEELKEMEVRVLKAIARADSLTEFKDLLSLIPGLPPEHVLDILEHENAHANVAEQMETVDFKGYGMVFFQDNGEPISVTPVVLTDIIEGANKIKFLEESVHVLEAPDTYGHAMSDDDQREAARLKDIYSQEIQDK